MMKPIPAIVINLDRSTDRLAAMECECARIGMPFERFPAVDGLDLPPSLRLYFCGADGELRSPLRPGEIGCYASHLGVWQRIAAGDYGPAALVSEDDIRFDDDSVPLLADILRQLPADWDVVRLSSSTTRRVSIVAPLHGERSLVRYLRSPLLAGATLVSHAGAVKLTRPGIRRNAIDAELFSVNEFGVLPRPVTHLPAVSMIAAAGGRRHHDAPRFMRKLLGWPDRMQRQAYGLKRMGLRGWLNAKPPAPQGCQEAAELRPLGIGQTVVGTK